VTLLCVPVPCAVCRVPCACLCSVPVRVRVPVHVRVPAPVGSAASAGLGPSVRLCADCHLRCWRADGMLQCQACLRLFHRVCAGGVAGHGSHGHLEVGCVMPVLWPWGCSPAASPLHKPRRQRREGPWYPWRRGRCIILLPYTQAASSDSWALSVLQSLNPKPQSSSRLVLGRNMVFRRLWLRCSIQCTSSRTVIFMLLP
jgi:hypothetical protein